MQRSDMINGIVRQAAGFALLLLILSVSAPPARAQGSVAEILGAVVRVQSETDSDARTARTLGTERDGNGVVIDSSGLILTIGYLVLEAANITVTGPDGKSLPASVVAYDHNTGFGLLRTAQPVAVKPMRLGDSSLLEAGVNVIVVGYGGGSKAIRARVVSRRDFTGYWEYLLPDAIFTQPPYALFSGAAMVDKEGRLVGIGSLVVGDAIAPDSPGPGNMFVPINALKPILGQLIANGRSDGPRRPWLGVYTEEIRGRVFVNRLANGGPGEQGRVAIGDIIVSVAGKPVAGQKDFYRKVWSLGGPGTKIPLSVLRHNGGLEELVIDSGDRYDWLQLDTSH